MPIVKVNSESRMRKVSVTVYALAMIVFCAAALDNGFRVIVVLTSDFLKLVEQTAQRLIERGVNVIQRTIPRIWSRHASSITT